ncbi:hypothetical protein [Vibrio sp. VB16]|uniref:hypothetical protein n=1 Tax=Vibrio sp. VB16 TaxID=2785746 RepID=UPI0018A0E1B4|nr:hypothetical protein [Vibrio sp. VB16]UGA57510.1 FG-GAP repeat protein [Vibrio sp. VB16]
MQKTPPVRWFKFSFLTPLAFGFLVGCGGGGENAATSSISSFNLLTLSASDSNIKQMMLNWTSASDDTGVTYSVCEKNTSKNNECNVLTTVTDSLNATISVSSLVDALTTDYFVMASNGSGEVVLSNEESLTASTAVQMVGYFKASNTGEDDGFGHSIALSGDGSTLAVGARDDDNGAVGVLTDGSETTDVAVASNAGAVYLFSNMSGSWTQVAYLKASNADSQDHFGYSLALNGDGSTLAVGAPTEDNSAIGVIADGSETTDTGSAPDSGAVYLFGNSVGNWVQTAYVKASNVGSYDQFGFGVALSNDGATLVVAAPSEDNSATGVITDGSETSDTGTAAHSGALYLFSKSLGSWAQTAYLKASNTSSGDGFGTSVALNGDGGLIAVGAAAEDNAAKGVIVDGSETVDLGVATQSGAVYLFSNGSGNWSQIAYVKASNTESLDEFGNSVAFSGDGSTLAVGATNEDNGVSGVITDGSEVTDTGLLPDSGAVYLFRNSTGSWVQTAYFKASNTGSSDYFGSSVSLSENGSILAVGAYGEDNGAIGILADSSETIETESITNTGAAYLFSNHEGSWEQTAYVKASNAGIGDFFGTSVGLSSDASTLVVGANNEDNGATGVIVDSSETSDIGSASNSGAVYLY